MLRAKSSSSLTSAGLALVSGSSGPSSAAGSRPGSASGSRPGSPSDTASKLKPVAGVEDVVASTHELSNGALTKADVDWLMGKLGDEDRAMFQKQFFLSDCHRRFQQLGADNFDLLQVQKVEQTALTTMFPTLKLDINLPERSIKAPASNGSWLQLVSLFDTDGDACIDEDEFRELMKFCQAWRATFYLREAQLGATTANRLNSARHSVRGGVKTDVRPKSSSALQRPGASQNRRCSGFGPRLHLVDQPACRSKLPAVIKGPRQGKRKSAPEDVSSEEVSRRGSVKERLDGTRGAFYCNSTHRDVDHTEEFLAFVEALDTRRGSYTVEEMHRHPIRCAPMPKTKFAGDRVMRSR